MQGWFIELALTEQSSGDELISDAFNLRFARNESGVTGVHGIVAEHQLVWMFGSGPKDKSRGTVRLNEKGAIGLFKRHKLTCGYRIGRAYGPCGDGQPGHLMI